MTDAPTTNPEVVPRFVSVVDPLVSMAVNDTGAGGLGEEETDVPNGSTGVTATRPRGVLSPNW